MQVIFFSFVFFFLLVGLLMNKKHFLMTLLVLESIMIMLLLTFYFGLPNFSVFLYLVFITLSACEGALGLSILVNLTRSYSSDYMLMFNTSL